MAHLIQQPLVMECTGWDSHRLLDRRGRPQNWGVWPTPSSSRTAGHVAARFKGENGAEWPAAGNSSDRTRWRQPLELHQSAETAGRSAGTMFLHHKMTPFRHLQFFPDMAPVWDWLQAQLVG
jgi:23S rRNA (cytosine1962-C5)-methyltransferase